MLCLILNDIVVFLRVEPNAAGQRHLSAAAAGSEEQAEALAGGLIGAVASALNQPASGQASGLQGQQPTAATGAASAASGAAGHCYHFANIDQKSSVISLSKLLVREKAAEGDEPRVYLISSSPSQPEMYELAFVSRRHQLSFVEKLKGAIEQHNSGHLRAQTNSPEDPFPSPAGACRSDSELSLDDQCCADDQCRRYCSACNSVANANHNNNNHHHRRRRRNSDEAELDIEQELVLEERPDDDHGHDEAHNRWPDSRSSQQPTGSARCLDSFCSASSSAGSSASSSSAAHSFAESSSSGLELQSGDEGRPRQALPEQQLEGGLSERARDSCGEQAAGRQKLRTGRRRRAQRPRQPSNQSCSSSASSSAAHRQAIELAASVQAVKLASGGPLTEAAKRAAGAEDEFDSGRGHDDSSSTSSQSLSLRAPGAPDEATIATMGPPAVASKLDDSQPASCELQAAKPAGLDRKSSAAAAPETQQASSKLRKLSSVSTMSSQLKLLTRLRNGFVPFDGSSGPPLCAQCQGQQAASQTSNTLNRQQVALNRRRSAQFVPEQKLEELRDLRIQLDRDKQEWQEKFERMMEQLLDERRELDLAREKLKQDRHQVANEREQLYRKLDVLKEKGILLSPSHKVIITSPNSIQLFNPAPPPSISFHQVAANSDHSPQHQQAQAITIGEPQQMSQRIVVASCNPTQAQLQAPQPMIQVPIHLSQQRRQQPVGGRLPFIGAFPGANFLAERFGANSAASNAFGSQVL